MNLAETFAGADVLVTGGLGFIGSNVARRLVQLGARVTLVDSMIPDYGGNLFNVHDIRDDVTVNIADVRDRAAMDRLVQGRDYLFNLAGQVSHIDSMLDPFTDLDINCRSQLSILESCRHNNLDVKVVFAGSRQQYGRPRYLPVDEEHPLRPADVNGVNKMAGEAYHLLFHDVYGPGMRIKDARQNFLGIWLRLVIEGKPFEVWGGEQRRDMLYIEDAVDAFLAAAVSPATEGLALNVGGDAPYTLTDIAAALVTANGGGNYAIREFPEERKKIDVGDFVTDDRRFRELADWAPRTSLAEGLARSIAYYRPRMPLYV